MKGEEKSGARARLGPELGRGGLGAVGLAHAGEGREGGIEVGRCCEPKGGRGRDSAQVAFSIF